MRKAIAPKNPTSNARAIDKNPMMKKNIFSGVFSSARAAITSISFISSSPHMSITERRTRPTKAKFHKAHCL